jgi:hypothetical protein
MHDWSTVIAGIFHHFHQRWIGEIADRLNADLLPNDYYALAERIAEGPIPDVLTLEQRAGGSEGGRISGAFTGGVALADAPHCVRYTLEADQELYAAKANRVTVYHASGDRVVAYVEIVSPGNKQSEAAIARMLNKLADAIRKGCHLLVIDPHPPTPRDPRGLHARFWEDYSGKSDSPGVTDDQPFGLMAYRSVLVPTAYFEPFAIGDSLIDMPLFFTPDKYVNVPLEATYQEVFRRMPQRWKSVIQLGA